MLAFAFAGAGVKKLTSTYEAQLEEFDWVEDFSLQQLRMIGTLEIAGAVGVVLPALTGIVPELTVLAALGLALVMLVALLTHLRRQEYVPFMVINSVLLAFALIVVVGRGFIEPF